MNVAVSLRRTTAARAMGTCWCVDHERRVMFENLGRGRPPFFFGDVHASLEEATASAGGYETRPLPETLRLPRGTPVALASGKDLSSAATKVHLLRFDSIMERGLRVEEARMSAVDYAPAPHHLKGFTDFVAVAVYLEGERRLRIRIAHDKDGFPFVSEAPQREEAWGWTSCPDALAFLDVGNAQDHADAMAARLRAAADWRQNG